MPHAQTTQCLCVSDFPQKIRVAAVISNIHTAITRGFALYRGDIGRGLDHGRGLQHHEAHNGPNDKGIPSEGMTKGKSTGSRAGLSRPSSTNLIISASDGAIGSFVQIFQ
ncbi:hypothetical protein J1614_007045 [Plenodomus biglobosus]|nr:hypothetical protein J1614_007045 [Plenodomus biglobosus]